MFDEKVLAGMSLAPPRAEPSTAAVRVQLRLPWYRSLQLSCIEKLHIRIDGDDQPQDRLKVVINGYAHALPVVAQMHEAWWFVLDTIDVEIAAPEPLRPGTHDVGVALQLRIPYGDPDFSPLMEFKQVVECAKQLTLLGRSE